MKRVFLLLISLHLFVCLAYSYGLNGFWGIPGIVQVGGMLFAICVFWVSLVLLIVKRQKKYAYLTGISLAWWVSICAAQYTGSFLYCWHFNHGQRRRLEQVLANFRKEDSTPAPCLVMSTNPFTAVFVLTSWQSRAALIYAEDGRKPLLRASRDEPNIDDLGSGWFRWVFGSYTPVFNVSGSDGLERPGSQK